VPKRKPPGLESIDEILVDAYGCEANLNDVEALRRLAVAAVQAVGATVAETASHRFQPHGTTICLILKESHLILSTWPEHGMAIVNLFLCNPRMSTRDCWKILEHGLKPRHSVIWSVSHSVGPLESLEAA